MNRFNSFLAALGVVILAAGTAAPSAHGALFSGDLTVADVGVSIAGGVTYDSESNLQWLDVPLTTSQSFNQISAGYTPVGWNKTTLTAGFRYATTTEVATFFAHGLQGVPGVTTSVPLGDGFWDTSTSSDIIFDAFIDLVGVTIAAPNGIQFNGIFDAGGSRGAGTVRRVPDGPDAIFPNATFVGCCEFLLGDSFASVGSYLVRAQDTDGDGVPDDLDNSPLDPNPDQQDNDGDNIGDVSDPDDDNDGVADVEDNEPFNPLVTKDEDGDGVDFLIDPDDQNPNAVGYPIGDAGGPYELDLGLGNLVAFDASGSFLPNAGGIADFFWGVGGLDFDTRNAVDDFDVSSLGAGTFDVFLTIVDLIGNPTGDRTTLTILAANENDDVASVPEPGTITLFGFGLVGLRFMARRRKKIAA